jgi:hypothetical protein
MGLPIFNYMEVLSMANHLTPTELADELKMQRQEVIGKCVEMGVPIFHGRIDRTLFEMSMRSLPAQASLQPSTAIRH